MGLPYGWTFAVLCALQGVLVAFGGRRQLHLGRSALLGAALPVGALAIGLIATRQSGWSTDLLATVASVGAPLAALGASAATGGRPLVSVVLAPVAFLVAWRIDGLVGEAAGVALIAAACLTLAALIAATAPRQAIAIGLVVLAIIDTVLVFRGTVATSTATLHAVEPPTAAGRPLPALQDATLGGSLFGWLDLLAPALAGMLFVERPRARAVAAVATGAAALAWALLLAVTDQVPGTVPPLVAVAIWALTRPRHPHITVREVTIRPLDGTGRGRRGRVGA